MCLFKQYFICSVDCTFCSWNLCSCVFYGFLKCFLPLYTSFKIEKYFCYFSNHFISYIRQILCVFLWITWFHLTQNWSPESLCLVDRSICPTVSPSCLASLWLDRAFLWKETTGVKLELLPCCNQAFCWQTSSGKGQAVAWACATGRGASAAKKTPRWWKTQKGRECQKEGRRGKRQTGNARQTESAFPSAPRTC